MMSTITIRVDGELKEEASTLFNDLGMDMTTACTMFLKKAVAVDGIPFSVSRTPNKETRRAIADAMKERNLEGPYKTMEDLKATLDA